MPEKTDADDAPDVEIVKSTPDSQTGSRSIVLARDTMPPQLPIIPINNRPLFPKMTVPIVVDDDGIRKLLSDAASARNKFVGLILRKEQQSEHFPESVPPPGFYSVGVVAEILQMGQMGPRGPIQILLGAIERFRITAVIQEKPYLTARVEYLWETEMTTNQELKAYSVSVIQSIQELVKLNPLHKEELNIFLSQSNLADPGRLADFAAALTTAGGQELQDILETVNIRNRLSRVLLLLRKEIDLSKIQVRIAKQIEDKLSKQQREFFLREQLKAIKKELGLAKEGKEAEMDRFEERLKHLHLSDEASERIQEELEKLRLLEPASPEYHVTHTYLDWLTVLPWGILTQDSYNIQKATRILNHDHFGLEDVKQRILEFLAVGIMKGNISGSILCFVGPPGVGKTSLGQSIARSIGRHFYRFSLGGIHDEAEIKGHRRTYIGALPGKFIQTVKICKSANPVIMLDEIDKIGHSFRGDPASALLEVLDPEQNKDFLDHYLDVRFDLSNVFFICTANQTDTIPQPLLDRMEMIKLAGYVMQEKLQIARRHLIPKQVKEHGLNRGAFTISDPAVRQIIDGYAREPGVRGLENHIKKIIRKSVRKIVETKTRRIQIDTSDVVRLLGKPLFVDESLYKKPIPGVVMGLAWTTMGGETLFVEAAPVAAEKPGFKQTGQLGNVMVESSEIAYTYIRSFLSRDDKARRFFERNFIHLHVPAGATPKDGPSAGITMACALYSLVRQCPVHPRLAMTGELTLTGRIMPIGGVKEKTIAAKRIGVKHLVFPEGNRRDFEELPQNIRKGIRPYFVSTFRQAIAACFPDSSSRPKAGHPPRVSRKT